MKKIFRKIYTFFVKPYIKWKISKDQWIDYQDIRLLVKKGVFHPFYFYSTKFLIEFLSKEKVENKKILELGAGSGLISFYFASKKNAIITATDISKIAIEGLNFNNKNHANKLTIFESDLFENIPTQVFDFIIVNPPYYKKNPSSETESAWYCGENFEYFSRLFKQINLYIDKKTEILMVLSDDCEINKISEIANQFGFIFTVKKSRKFYFEQNFIFKISKNNASI